MTYVVGTLLWNKSFIKQLCQLADRRGLLGSRPEGYTDEPIATALGPPPTAKRIGELF
jgi:hypothetical protein